MGCSVGYSKTDLAAMAGIGLKELQQYEQDDWQRMPAFTLIKLAEVLNVPVDFLTGKMETPLSAQWLSWWNDYQQVSDRTKELIFHAMDALINYDKVKSIYTAK